MKLFICISLLLVLISKVESSDSLLGFVVRDRFGSSQPKNPNFQIYDNSMNIVDIKANLKKICQEFHPKKLVIFPKEAWKITDLFVEDTDSPGTDEIVDAFQRSEAYFGTAEVLSDSKNLVKTLDEEVLSSCGSITSSKYSDNDFKLMDDTLYILSSITDGHYIEVISKSLFLGLTHFQAQKRNFDLRILQAKNETDSPYMSKNQFFSPAIFMGLFAGLFSLLILLVGLAALANIQTPSKFEEQPKVKTQ